MSELATDASRKTGHKSWCRECDRKRNALYYSENREARAEYFKANNDRAYYNQIRRWYGMSESEYDARYAAQGGCCAGCGSPETTLCVDHDHSCCPTKPTCGGCNRLLLCGGCNKALGFALDSPAILRNLAKLVESTA